ncbi:hypothetical protein MOKP104_16230 [Mycobacterium avium subsp. hominissuis]
MTAALDYDPFWPVLPHTTFGHGAHQCLGMHLARIESAAVVGVVLDELHGLRLDDSREHPRIVGALLRGPEHLHVRFDRSGRCR